jgi:hypothetical protein
MFAFSMAAPHISQMCHGTSKLQTRPPSPGSLSSCLHLTYLRCVMAFPTCTSGGHRHVRLHHDCTSHISDVSLRTQPDTPTQSPSWLSSRFHLSHFRCVIAHPNSHTSPITLFAFMMAASHIFQMCHCVPNLTGTPNRPVRFRHGCASHISDLSWQIQPRTSLPLPCSLLSCLHFKYLRCDITLPTCKTGRHRQARFHHGCTSHVSGVSLHTQPGAPPQSPRLLSSWLYLTYFRRVIAYPT